MIYCCHITEMLSFNSKSCTQLPVVALLQTDLHILHLRTATDSHVTTSGTLWTFHVLVVPPEDGKRLVDRGTLRLVDGDAKRWTPVAVEVAGRHFNQFTRPIEGDNELVCLCSSSPSKRGNRNDCATCRILQVLFFPSAVGDEPPLGELDAALHKAGTR